MSATLNGYSYEVDSRVTGSYAGPCPFTGQGDDRFAFWPSKGTWYCRKECSNCPGTHARAGGMTGFLDDFKDEVKKIPVQKTKPVENIPLSRVEEYHKGLNKATLDYLEWRGINRATAEWYMIGTNCRRLTIPCVVRDRVYGIKKRWIGTPPEEYILKYVMEPGSTGRAIFNYNVLKKRRQWDRFLIVESEMDVMLLTQLGIGACCSFGGGGMWEPAWSGCFDHVDNLIVVADNDEDGMRYAEQRIAMLGRGRLVVPPKGNDMGEAFQQGVDLRKLVARWAKETPK